VCMLYSGWFNIMGKKKKKEKFERNRDFEDRYCGSVLGKQQSILAMLYTDNDVRLRVSRREDQLYTCI